MCMVRTNKSEDYDSKSSLRSSEISGLLTWITNHCCTYIIAEDNINNTSTLNNFY